MIDSLEEMIDRQSQEQVSQILLESLWRNLLYVRCTMYLAYRASGKEKSLRLSVDELIFVGLKLTFCKTDIFVKANYKFLRLYI